MSAPPPRRRVAIVADGSVPDSETSTLILVHCPIVRMGRGRGRYMQADDESGRVYVVPPELCIGCGICVTKNPATVAMIDW